MLRYIQNLDENFYKNACDDTHRIFEENSGAVDFVINVLNDHR